MNSKAKKGIFRPRNPKKYKGDSSNIVYRSSWELRCMKIFDEEPNIIEWSSEEEIVKYRCPMTGRARRYFPDFLVTVKNKEGKLEKRMIEIKPYAQTKAPSEPKRKTQRYLQEVATYVINQRKWEAAEAYCSRRGWTFQVLTEKQLWNKK